MMRCGLGSLLITVAFYQTCVAIPRIFTTPNGNGYSQQLTIDNAYHDAGEWGVIDLCQSGSYAYAIEVKYNPPGHIDETAINGIKLYCARPNGQDTGYVSSSIGRHGSWWGMQICSNNYSITGFRANVLEYQGPFTDDVAVEDIQVYCNYGDEVVNGIPIHVPRKTETRDFQAGKWSSWANCDKGSSVCGIQTRYEDYSAGDEVSIADVNLFCCKT